MRYQVYSKVGVCVCKWAHTCVYACESAMLYNAVSCTLWKRQEGPYAWLYSIITLKVSCCSYTCTKIMFPELLVCLSSSLVAKLFDTALHSYTSHSSYLKAQKLESNTQQIPEMHGAVPRSSGSSHSQEFFYWLCVVLKMKWPYHCYHGLIAYRLVSSNMLSVGLSLKAFWKLIGTEWRSLPFVIGEQMDACICSIPP